MKRLNRTVFAVAAVFALLLTGVAAAQDGQAPADPQTMCEDAGGEWNGETQSCGYVWCGWDNDPPICDWMEQQNPVPVEGDGAPAPEVAPAQPTPAQPAPATQTQPQYTG